MCMIKYSRDGVADLNGMVDGALGTCNSRKSRNTAGLIAGVSL